MEIMSLQVEDTYTEGYLWSAWQKQESNWRFIIGNFDTLDETMSDITNRLNLVYIDRNQCEKSAAESRDMNSEQFDREFDLEQAIKIIASEDAELLERLKDD